MSRRRTLQFGVVTGTLAAGYGVMFTVLDDFRDDYGIAAYWLGAIVGIGFLAAVVAQIFLAPLADRGHARVLVVVGLLLDIAGLLALGFGTTLPVLLAGRVVSGVGMGMAFPAIRRIVIVSDPDRVGNNVGLLLAADVAGFALGPAIAAVMVPSFGLASPFVAIASACALVLPFVLRVRTPEPLASSQPVGRLAFDLLRDRRTVAGLMMGSAVFLMIGTFDALWVIVLDDLDASELVANIGITLFAMPLIFLGSTGGRLAERVGPFRVGPIGLMIGATCMFLYGHMPSGAAMLTVGLVHAVFDGLTVASAGVAVATSVPPERQAGAQGLLGAVEAATAGVTAMLAGVLYSIGGRVLAYTTCSVLMISLAAGAYVLAERCAASSDRLTLPASSRT